MSGPGIIRVFPRRTNATPIDPMAFVGDPPLWRPPREDVRAVLVSAAFSWDLAEASRLAGAWHKHYPIVRLGGPALGDPGGEFEPGMYLRPGYVITSRGCPGRKEICEHCLVPQREGQLRMLQIRDGWDVLDNNLLACSAEHIEQVFAMLRRQPKRPVFSGGLEASKVSRAIAQQLVALKFDVAYTAYDRPGQAAAVERAIGRLREAGGWSMRRAQRKLGCYVLCGYRGDTAAAIVKRLRWICELGVTPFPMFYRGPELRKDPALEEMRRELRKWMRPARIFRKEKDPPKEAGLPFQPPWQSVGQG